jgi:ABC-type uncharacterized transport system substrate-binding protein
MRRRDVIAGLGATAALPFAARAQQKMPVVGFLRTTSRSSSTHRVAAFRRGLKEAGFIEGQNVAVEYRFADGHLDRLPALLAELIGRKVGVIVANVTAVYRLKSLTTTVPIVFMGGIDPVRDGLVASLNRPGGNVTGVSFLVTALAAKRLELLHQLAPKVTTIAALVNRGSPQAEVERNDLPAAAQAIGLRLLVLDVGSERDFETAFATAVQSGAGAMFVGGGAFLASRRERLVALAARHRLPASYPLQEFVAAGGLMSYGSSIGDAYRQTGIYAGRILKGEKPAELPVMRAAKFELVINRRTAKALGLEIHPQLLATADEVIE